MKKSTLKNIIIFLIFFFQTMSFVMTLNLNSIKYVSMIMLNGLIIIFCMQNLIKKNELLSFFILLILLTISCVFQSTSFYGKITSITFYFTLLMWTLMSYKVINNKAHIIYISCGILFGVIIGLGLTFNEVIVQLASIYNSRSRLWGGFTHPNHLGGIISSSLIGLYVYNFINKIEKRYKILYVITISILIVLLYATKSRTSWIVTIVAIVVMNMKYIATKPKIVKLFTYSLIIVGGLYISYFFITEYALQEDAFLGRLRIFETMNVTPSTFLVGNGMVGASSLDRTNTNGGAMEIAWVMLFYKNGIIGVISFISIILILVKRLSKVTNINQIWAFRGILTAFMIGTLGEAYLVNITNVPALFNWVMLSVLSSNKFTID